jgi:hypothetical protein
MNGYDQQAEKFLKETKTTFKAEFLRHGKHFIDDKEERDIYQITLTKGERSYTFNFGQSLDESGLFLSNLKGKRTGHRGFILPDEMRKDLERAEKQKEPREIKQRFRRWFKKEYFSLSGLKWEFKYPSAYDVLACLQKHEVGTLKDFCGQFGYSEDSIKASKIYEGVKNEYENLKMLYTEAELEKMREIN